jgi:hypothetical protein
LWIFRSLAGSNVLADDSQIERIADDVEGRTTFDNLSSALRGQSAGVKENLRGLLDHLLTTTHVPQATLIPSIRAVEVSDEIGGPSLPGTSGRGLPQWLVALQSPGAGRHREDRQKFERMRFSHRVGR